MSDDLPVKAARKTIKQTGIILNVHPKTVKNYLAQGKLKWAGNQVCVESIKQYLKTATPKDEDKGEDDERTNIVPRERVRPWARRW